MKSLIFIGVILLGLAGLVFYFNGDFKFIELFRPTPLMATMSGIGIGLIIGGIVGYVSKGSAIKQAEKRRQFEQLEKEKIELEKQAAALAKTTQEKNTQF